MKHVVAVLAVTLLAACGGPPEKESINAEACEHLKQGPSSAVTATTAAAGAPNVSEAHQRFDVTLVDVTGGKGGAVSYSSGAEGDLILFLSESVPLKVSDSAGADVAMEATVTSIAECDEVKARHTVPVAVGTYTLTFGPTTVSTVQLVAETEAHAH